MEPTMNITRADVRARRPRPGPVPYGIRLAQVPRGLFVAELIARGFVHLAQDSFRGRAQPAALAELGTAIMIRADGQEDDVEALLLLPGGELGLIDAGHGHVWIDVAARTRSAAAAAMKRLRDRLHSDPPVPDRVSIAFWMRGEAGGDVRHREIEAPRFRAIASNYPTVVRRQLERLFDVTTPSRGRLILWRGAPGTGKSHALRALVRAWADWCSAHFIMDPDELLGRGGAYMLDLLSEEEDDEDRWRLLILEDAGDLIAADARSVAGQALSRLLNVADGLLGQGTNTLLLITTNEPLGRLHPAVRRPGRCLADIEFVPFSPVEALAWLADHGSPRDIDAPTTLAELFNRTDDGAQVAGDPPPRFGFARALDEDPRR
jgi:ATPase family associated with various cellular activities (AAA)